MRSSSRAVVLFLVSLGFVAAACHERPAPFEAEVRTTRADYQAPFNPPKAYPPWAYDQPEYHLPAETPMPELPSKPGESLHYYTADNVVMIGHPDRDGSEETPRVAVWWTGDNGLHWHKAGHLGRGQSYFPFEVPTDGDYGVRFVGPDLRPAQQAPAFPEHIYHVDTTEPEVRIVIDPEQGWYNVGQLVNLSWRATDYHLEEYPVRISLLKDFAISASEPVELQRDLAAEGSIVYEIPTDALDHEIMFRIEATDRACNLGLAYSHPLRVLEEPFELISHHEVSDVSVEMMSVVADDVESSHENGIDSVSERDATQNQAILLSVLLRLRGYLTEAAAGLKEKIAVVATSAREPDVVESHTSVDDEDADQVRVVESDSIEREHDASATFAEAQAVTHEVGERPESEFAFEETDVFVAAENSDNETNEEQTRDNLIEPMTSSESLVVGSSRPVPFATAVARLADGDARLLWEGSATLESMGSGLALDQQPAQEFRDTDLNQMVAVDSTQPETVVSQTIDRLEGQTTDYSDTVTIHADAGEQVVLEDPPESHEESRSIAELTSVDLTRGNGMLIPLPATVVPSQQNTLLATAHPWRTLSMVWDSTVQTIWRLPEPRLNFGWRPTFKGRFLADHPALRTVAKPGESNHVFIGAADDVMAGDVP